jgi:hypothetical protein
MDTYIPVVEGCQAASPDSGSITTLPAEQEWNNNPGKDKGIRLSYSTNALSSSHYW